MYSRVLLKLSGEALKGTGRYGLDPKTIKEICLEIKKLVDAHIQVAIICGAGNLWRGKIGEELGMDRSQADFIGMLGTVMNSLALQDALESINVDTRVMSAIAINAVAEPYIRRKALSHLNSNRVVIIAGGTGNPYFSTDTAAVLRAAELDCKVVLMAKNGGIKGVYDKDPNKYKDAKFIPRITYSELIEKKLEVIDLTSCTMAQENKIELVIFDINGVDNILKAALQHDIGTKVVG